MENLQELYVDVREPITSDQYLQLDGVLDFMIQNCGDANVYIDNFFTVKPGSPPSFGTPALSGIFSGKIKVTFDPAATTKRLEVVFVRARNHPSNFPQIDC